MTIGHAVPDIECSASNCDNGPVALIANQSVIVAKGFSADDAAADFEKQIDALSYVARIVSVSVTSNPNAFYLVAALERV